MLGALGITSIFMLHSESFSVWDSIWVILSTFLHHHRTVSSGNEVFLVFFRCFFTNWDTPKGITLFKLNIPTPSFGSTSGVPSLTKVYLSFWIHPLWRIGHPKNLIPQCNFPSFPARRRPLTFVAFSANSAGANPLCNRSSLSLTARCLVRESLATRCLVPESERDISFHTEPTEIQNERTSLLGRKQSFL